MHGPNAPSPAASLVARHPRLPAILLALVPIGLAAAWVWLRLGDGPIHSFRYWCLLFSMASVLVAVQGATGWACCRMPDRRIGRWCGVMTGVGFSLMLLIGLYLVAQGLCWIVNEGQAARFERTGTHSDGDIYRFSRVLGYMPRPDSEAGARFVVDGEEVFDYHYKTDHFSRRVVAAQAGDNRGRDRALLFFGGSYTFGEGVNDGETMPDRMAELLPGVSMYNYGFSGYGPHHMLARLESMNTRSEIPEPTVAAVYTFIPHHVRRVIGAFSVMPWSRHAPYYVLTPSGEAAKRGSFQGERPWRTGLYELLKGDHVLQRFPVDIPYRVGKSDMELTAAIIARSAAVFAQKFDSTHFYVLLYPRNATENFDGSAMRRMLEARGLHVLDYTDLLPGPLEDHYYLPHDSHPKPETHAAVAEKLARDLAFLQGEE